MVWMQAFCGSFASAGYVVDDFKAQQFTLDARGSIYLVDGPRLLAEERAKASFGVGRRPAYTVFLQLHLGLEVAPPEVVVLVELLSVEPAPSPSEAGVPAVVLLSP